VIVEDSAPPSVLIVGRLARGTTGEARRVVHVFGLDAARSTIDLSGVPGGGAPGRGEAPHEAELVRTKCGEALSRADVEWPAPGAGMPCEPCLGLTGGERARSPRRELGV
jgi:hypothetical protein